MGSVRYRPKLPPWQDRLRPIFPKGPRSGGRQGSGCDWDHRSIWPDELISAADVVFVLADPRKWEDIFHFDCKTNHAYPRLLHRATLICWNWNESQGSDDDRRIRVEASISLALKTNWLWKGVWLLQETQYRTMKISFQITFRRLRSSSRKMEIEPFRVGPGETLYLCYFLTVFDSETRKICARSWRVLW